MGLRDDDEQIFAERALLDWAREAPQRPGSYDEAPTEEQLALHDYATRKWLESRPTAADNFPSPYNRVPAIGGGNFATPTKKKPKKKPKKKTTAKLKTKAKPKKPVNRYKK